MKKCYWTTSAIIVKIFRRSLFNHVNPTYRESFTSTVWRGCPTYSLTRVYICHPTYRENFKYKKKGLRDFVRLKPNPTYRVSDLSSLPMYLHIAFLRADSSTR